jgi:hypothetical protein
LGREGNVRATEIDACEAGVLRKEFGEGRVERGEITCERGPKEGDVLNEPREGIRDKAGSGKGSFAEGGCWETGWLENKGCKGK